LPPLLREIPGESAAAAETKKANAEIKGPLCGEAHPKRKSGCYGEGETVVKMNLTMQKIMI
jgi:hypothetical protein